MTGYFGRATNGKLSKKVSKYIHSVVNNKPICRYKPHPTMIFQWCATDNVTYVDCPQCLKKLFPRKSK